MKPATVLVLVLVLSRTRSQDNDRAVDCQTCNCTSDDAQILKVNCSNKTLNHVGGTWPPHNSTIIISFAGNDIPTLEPLPQTDAVVEIVLSRCHIKYLTPSLFADAKNVKFVDLSYNEIPAEQVSSDKFRGPYNNSQFEPIALEHLNLAHNRIHSLGNNVFEHMPDLKILNLEGNDFKYLDIQTQLAVSSVRKLQSLNLADNELTEMIAGAIKQHENLTELDISKNSLDFVPSSLAQIGKSLEVLKLDDNPIMEFTSQTFLGLGNVIELSANNLTRLKYVNANTFASMPKLKNLSLSNNFLLNDIDREAFGINQTLEEFYLSGNSLYRLDYKLLPWSKLHVFECEYNPFDCTCDLYNITTALPDDITRLEDGPYCMDPRTKREMQVYYLKADICSFKPKHLRQAEYIQHHFSIIRIALIVLSIIVAIAAILAAGLGLVRYLKYRRNLSYPYATYSSVNSNPKF